LEEHQILLSLQEMDLELWEVILAECSLHHLDGWDLSVELGKIHVRINGINSERVTQFG
jgi:hypothetical protein